MLLTFIAGTHGDSVVLSRVIATSLECSAVGNLLGGMINEVQWGAGARNQLSFLTQGQQYPPPTLLHRSAVSIILTIFLNRFPILVVLGAQD